MARTRKSIQPLNLHKYDVLIEDRGTRSDYFKITQFDGYFYGGRNAFLIAGTSVLKPNSAILVEILNVNGETVYSAPISNFIEGNSRLIQVEVYSDTPIGPGKIVVLGNAATYLDGTPVPAEWSNKYNVRWVTDVVISPLINNKTPLRFVNTPTATVEEKFYPIAATASFSQSVLVEFGDYELTPVNYNTVQNGYLIKLKNPTTQSIFASEQLGGSFETLTTLQGTSEFIYTQLPITKIFNSTLAESRGTLITSSLGTVITKMTVSGSGSNYSTDIQPYGQVTVASSINRIRYNKLVEFNDNTTDTSFAKLRISNLNTISGEINKIRVSYKVTTEPGDFIGLSDSAARVEELLAIDSGSKIISLGQFNKIKLADYWYAATSSLAKNEIDPTLPNYYFSSSVSTNLQPSQSSDVLLDSIFITPEIENSTYKNYTSYFIGTTNAAQLSLLPNSEYTLKLNALFTNISESVRLNQTDNSVEIYLVKTETSNGTLLETNPRGQLLGTLTPSANTQLFENIEFNFKPKIISGGTFGLRLVVYGGFWNFSNVSVKVAEETFFSPDEVTLLIPTVNRSDELLTFKTEFLDIDNNSSKITATTIPTIFTGSSDYVKKSGDSMTGELFIKGLPIQQQSLQDGFTGLVSGGLITVNTPASWSYTISSGSGYVIDNYTDPFNPTYTYVTWPEIIKMPSAFITTGSVASYPRTNIAISASGEVIEQSAEWTALDYRRYIILGRIAHVGTTFIQRALSLPLTTYNRGFHWFDLANAIGILNVEGNVFYASGSSMSIGKTAGKTYRVGSNYRNDATFPDITTDPASLPTSFAYRYRSGSGFKEEPLTTIISGNLYDNGSGVLQTVNPNKFTVQRIYYFGATNTTRIQFGQNVYDTLTDAQTAANSEVFVADPNLDRDSSLRAYLIVGSSATNLSNSTDAEFITIGKFGAGGTGGGGGGGGATALSGLTDVNLSGPTSGQLLQYNGSVWVNGTNVATLATTGSNTFIGNQTITGSLNVNAGITGSLFGTSSWALNAITASYALNSTITNNILPGNSIGVAVWRSGSQTINGSQAVSFTTEYRDDLNFWTSTNPTRITIPFGADGWYAIAGNVYWNPMTGLGRRGIITLNGVEIAGDSTSAEPDHNDPRLSTTAIRYLVEGDYLEWVMSENFGGTVDIYPSASLSAVRISSPSSSFASLASSASLALSSSYPFSVSGSTIYSTDTVKTNFPTDYAILIGNNAGNNSSGSSWTVFVGEAAGQNTQGSADSVFVGANAADSSTKMYQTVAVGEYAGAFSDDLYNAVAIGLEAGSSTKASPYSVFLGDGAAFAAFSSSYSNIIGATAGFRATSSFSTFIGVNAGGRLSGSNNIIIGNSIGLPNGTSNAVNIGGFLFGTGSYFDPNIYDYNIFTGSVGNGRLGINVVQPQHALHVSGSTVFDASVLETATVTATAATGTVNFDVIKQSVLYYTTNAAANWTLNIRGNSATSLNSMLNVGQSITVVFLVTNGSPAYYPTAHTIDGSAVTPKWQGGSAPTAGNANGIDVYVYSIIKTANATFTVLASQTNFS